MLLAANIFVLQRYLERYLCQKSFKSWNYLRLNFLAASTRQDAVSCNTWTTPRPSQSPIEPPTWVKIATTKNSWMLWNTLSIILSHRWEKAAQSWFHHLSGCDFNFGGERNVNLSVCAWELVQELCLGVRRLAGERAIGHLTPIHQFAQECTLTSKVWTVQLKAIEFCLWWYSLNEWMNEWDN